MFPLLSRRVFLFCITAWSILFVFLLQDCVKIASGGFRAIFFDVPVGDGILLRTPHGKDIVIDGGIDDFIVSQLPKERSFWQREIELLVLTHPDLDHLAGALAVLQRYPVRHLLITGATTTSGLFAEFLRLAAEKKVPLLFPEKVPSFVIDGVTVTVLWPKKNVIGQKLKNVNDTSVVLKTTFENISMLFAGDIEALGERELLAQPISLLSRVLKVAHHGSKTSSSPEFLAAVRPEFSVISAGKENHFGHPNVETLEALFPYSKNNIFVTKDLGSVTLSIADGALSVSP